LPTTNIKQARHHHRAAGRRCANDAIARVIAQKLSEQLGQTFIVDNRPGGRQCGHRGRGQGEARWLHLMITADSSMVINPSLYKSTGFDPVKDFQPVGTLATAGYVLVANPAFPAKNVAELIASRSSNPKSTSAWAGNGTLNHLIGEMSRQGRGH
jgi:tripartite-type tricarboxylate transporter receptor subunit TctC